MAGTCAGCCCVALRCSPTTGAGSTGAGVGLTPQALSDNCQHPPPCSTSSSCPMNECTLPQLPHPSVADVQAAIKMLHTGPQY